MFIHPRRVVVIYKPKYVHEVQLNRLVKFAQEKVLIGELTVSTVMMTIAVDKEVKPQTKKLQWFLLPEVPQIGLVIGQSL